MNVFIDPSWDFKTIVRHIKTLKIEYVTILMSFYFDEIIKQNEFMLRTRNMVYALNIKYFQRGLIWEYFNNDITYEEIKHISEHTN